MYVCVCKSVCMFFQLIWQLVSSSNFPVSTTLNVGVTGGASQACFVGSGIKDLDFILLQQAPLPSEPIFFYFGAHLGY